MANIRNRNICEECKHKEAFSNGFPCWKCIGIDLDNELFISEEFFVRKNVTNADRIRAMSDEELAEYYFHTFFRETPYCTLEECTDDNNCEACLREWLKQEGE